MNSKRKGNRGEHDFAHWLMDNGIKAYRNSMSGGSLWKGDISNNLDITIEVKTVKKMNVMDAWKQVSKDAGIAHNAPVLAIHFDGRPKGEWLMIMHNEDWLDLIKYKYDHIHSES